MSIVRPSMVRRTRTCTRTTTMTMSTRKTKEATFDSGIVVTTPGGGCNSCTDEVVQSPPPPGPPAPSCWVLLEYVPWTTRIIDLTKYLEHEHGCMIRRINCEEEDDHQYPHGSRVIHKINVVVEMATQQDAERLVRRSKASLLIWSGSSSTTCLRARYYDYYYDCERLVLLDGENVIDPPSTTKACHNNDERIFKTSTTINISNTNCQVIQHQMDDDDYMDDSSSSTTSIGNFLNDKYRRVPLQHSSLLLDHSSSSSVEYKNNTKFPSRTTMLIPSTTTTTTTIRPSRKRTMIRSSLTVLPTTSDGDEKCHRKTTKIRH